MAKITYIPVKLPARVRKNLLKLATGLMSQTPPPKFNMATYINFSVWDGETEVRRMLGLDRYASLEGAAYTPEVYTNPKCGTVACAAGHGPFYGIKKKAGESWSAYISRVFIPGFDDEREDRYGIWKLVVPLQLGVC